MYNFQKISRWISIRYTSKGIPFFLYKGQRYYLSDVSAWSYCPFILRTGGGFGISKDCCPEYIHGYSSDDTDNLFVELDAGNEKVRCYKISG